MTDLSKALIAALAALPCWPRNHLSRKARVRRRSTSRARRWNGQREDGRLHLDLDMDWSRVRAQLSAGAAGQREDFRGMHETEDFRFPAGTIYITAVWMRSTNATTSAR